VNGGDPGETSAAELFALLWGSLADMLGTAATATLLRRAIKQAASQSSRLEPVGVIRNGLDYEYRGELRAVAAELRVLLVELTGPVVVRRLARLAPFREQGIDFSHEASK
jgi:hypothetical protein